MGHPTDLGVETTQARCGLATTVSSQYQRDRADMKIDEADDGDFDPLTISSVVDSLDATPSPFLVPVARPSSTPFPLPETRDCHSCCLNTFQIDAETNSYSPLPASPPDSATSQGLPATHFEYLPTEVHEAILDHIFGYCVSPTSKSALRISSLTKGWSSAFRHSRRRELTALALVNRTWRALVQQRLFRHIKLKATLDSMENAMMFLARNHHISAYIKHIEIWFPVFQPTYGPPATTNSLTLPTVTVDGLTNATYILPANNCTLEDVLTFVGLALPGTTVLTLEGGERRKAPKAVFFNKIPSSTTPPDGPQRLRTLPSVRTLVTKGQWNLVRDNSDFETIMSALPNLEEWQGSYSKAKSKSYITATDFLPLLPKHVTNLRLCLETDYRREGVMPAFYYKVARKAHICSSLGQVLPSLEHFAYTGRICHHAFDAAMRRADAATSRLKSIDVTVKNCCRQFNSFHESGSGIQDMAFILAFEKLVLSAVKLMEKFKDLEYLRIRFVDLDSVLPPLNPYFLMKGGTCSGVWSELLIEEINRVRPGLKYAELSDTFGDIVYNKDGRMMVAPEFQRTRPTSLKFSNYRSLATRMTIQ